MWGLDCVITIYLETIKQTNVVIFAGGWGGQSACRHPWALLGSRRCSVWKWPLLTENLTPYVHVPWEWVTFEAAEGAGVLALLSLTKAICDDQGFNLPFPSRMGTSSPLDGAVLTQCHLFLASSCHETLPVHSMVPGPSCMRMLTLKRSH